MTDATPQPPLAEPPPQTPEQRSFVGRIIRFCLTNKLVVVLIVAAVILGGIVVAPFDWNLGDLPRYPVPTDAIPDIGEKQQIVFTEWPGRSPQDVQDQITYPLTTALLGVPEVKVIRSISDFGFSSIYIIFEDSADFYWARSRVQEKLNALPAGTLPPGVQPGLGPDATALGQVFWYTLEGRDPNGRPAGGWDLEELRTVQDWLVRYALYGQGVSEVASVGGFVRQYQVDVDPDAMRAYEVTLDDVLKAVQSCNLDVGAEVIELNRVEYIIRSAGYIRRVEDIENAVVKVAANVPVLVRQVGKVTLGPELRRGALDKGGAQAAGGIVVTRYGANPLEVIKGVRERAEKLAPGLPAKVLIDYSQVRPEEVAAYAAAHSLPAPSAGQLDQEAWLAHFRAASKPPLPPWATISKLDIVPFYDRTGLIQETLGTLYDTLYQQVLITTIVIVIMVMHLRSSVLISAVMPLAVLMTFLTMKVGGVDANIVSLSGIAIAVGTVVDMGIVICENILRHLDRAPPGEDPLETVHRAASEVGSAVLSACASTIISFLPVFVMPGPEGKLFRPLAFTKTFALASSILVAVFVIPPAAHILFCRRIGRSAVRMAFYGAVVAAGIAVGFLLGWLPGGAVLAFGLYQLARDRLPRAIQRAAPYAASGIALLMVGLLLTKDWEPLGPQRGLAMNLLFVGGLVAFLMGFFLLFKRLYPRILGWCLRHKLLFLSAPATVLVLGLVTWLGFDKVFGFVPRAAARAGIDPNAIRSTTLWVRAIHGFPGLGKEFMPPLDEGAFLYMPTLMPHASIGEALDVLAQQDAAFQAIPEVDTVVGKIGRAETALDPAPVSMIETVINYKPEYITDRDGRRVDFRYDRRSGQFLRDAAGRLIPDPTGRPYRQWRNHIRSTDDIWKEIVAAGKMPGVTSSPKLQPIITRIIMLQTGMRAPMGVKVEGPSLQAVEEAGVRIERFLKEVPLVDPATVIADRTVGKPYLQIEPDREALARYGVSIRAFQDVVEAAIGGMQVTTTVEGRQRFGVRVRYQRELRDSMEALGKILIPGNDGVQIPLQQLARIEYVRGPQMIKSENAALVGYVLFDMKPGNAEVEVVDTADRYLAAKKVSGELVLPAGVTYKFAGNYENQRHAERTLMLMVPLSLFAIFIVLYFQFRAVPTTLMVFVGVLVAWGGGFLLIWLYGQEWFLNFSILGVNLRELFHVHPVNLSVAIWVGFLALFGVADDDGVVMSTYLEQTFRDRRPGTVAEIRSATLEAGSRRIRPCLMTTATTILALIPVFTSVGRGSDIMIPMAIPSFGGMTIEIMTMLIVPVLYCLLKELRLKHAGPLR